MSYLDQFKEHIQHQDFQTFCELWEEYCLCDEVEAVEFEALLRQIFDSPFEESFGQVATQGLALLEKLDDPSAKNTLFSLIADLQTTNQPQLADQIIAFLKETYPQDEASFNDKLRLVGLKDKKQFQSCIRNFTLLNHLHKGNFVFHTAGWGVGEIVDVSFLREEVDVELDLVQGVKALSFQSACKTLKPLDKSHFLAQRFGDPDELEAKAKKDPLYVLHLLLNDLGPMNAAEIKDELLELVIPEEDWNKWWQLARNKLKKDAKITAPAKPKDPFILHDEELSHGDRILKKLEQKASPEQFIDLVYSFLRDFPQTVKNRELNTAISSYLEKMLQLENLSDSEHLSLLLLLDEVSPGKEAALLKEKVQRASSLANLINSMNITAYKRKVLSIALKERENSLEEMAQCLLTVDQQFAKDYILQLLMENDGKGLVEKVLDQALMAPTNYAKVTPWYLQKALKDKKLPLTDQEGLASLFEALLITISSLEHKAEHRDLVKKMVQMLTNARFKLVRDIFKTASIEQIREFLLLATKCHVLTEQDIEIFYSLGEVVFPKLKKERKKAEVVEEEPQIWATEQGYQAMAEKIKHISTVETVDNAKEIEEARSHGDLRENAEFKAALERRDRLQSELAFLSKQYNQARILRKEDVKTESVGIGVVVHCTSTDGQNKIYTILGPFEADAEKNIISSQSKMAQDLLGKEKGDKVMVRNEELTITDLRNYFD